jgi:hypothetical protein
MTGDQNDAHKSLPVVLKPVADELLSSWLGRHATYYGVTGPFLAKWLMLGTRNLSADSGRCRPAMQNDRAPGSGMMAPGTPR